MFLNKFKLNANLIGESRILNILFKPAGIIMGSNLRRRFLDPVRVLKAADVRAGQSVLEVGCGTGFFTIPAAKVIGDQGSLIAMDVSRGFLEDVSKKLSQARIENVRVEKRDALDTKLCSESVEKALLFGVIPFPLLPLNRLLPEMHRVLEPEGTMAIWLFPPLVHFWVPIVIQRSGLFTFINRKGQVYNFKRRGNQSVVQ